MDTIEAVAFRVELQRLERGRFVWPQVTSGSVALTPAQLSMLLEGIDWRQPERTWALIFPCEIRFFFTDFLGVMENGELVTKREDLRR